MPLPRVLLPFVSITDAASPVGDAVDAWQYLRMALVLIGVLFVGWLLLRPTFAFVVRIRNGVPQVHKGRVAGPLLAELAAFCADQHLQSGAIYGVRLNRRIMLGFSRGISAADRQRIRNLWAIYR